MTLVAAWPVKSAAEVDRAADAVVEALEEAVRRPFGHLWLERFR
jgi:phosphoribosyl-dephospho-CoA transferase